MERVEGRLTRMRSWNKAAIWLRPVLKRFIAQVREHVVLAIRS